ncbi:hypothetical protein [Streptomyces sp. NPDC002785]|uniref:hypothetical protein n=1 Tax=Streptomyces sp. NPDC002785 TaxID=3154543 RepID=UPI00332C772F
MYEVDGREVQFVRPADTSDMAWAVYDLVQYRGMVYAEPHCNGPLWRFSASAARHRELAEAVRALRRP